ncbi:MAG: DUF3311 domain-containing protein [Polyangiaceae bacterium]
MKTDRVTRFRALHVLLVVPFIGTLWVPFFNKVEPTLGGVPFFYWYQFMWIPIGASITALLYFVTRKPAATKGAPEKNS